MYMGAVSYLPIHHRAGWIANRRHGWKTHRSFARPSEISHAQSYFWDGLNLLCLKFKTRA
jgi:hypothetical protein